MNPPWGNNHMLSNSEKMPLEFIARFALAFSFQIQET
ncbi:hypothetical protein O999_02250 [Pseudomonas putida LF54]|nr:hypothetical protein O999_02250 [Pseudomonas putida LF54]